MNNVDDMAGENTKEYDQNSAKVSLHLYKILIAGGSE